MAVKDEMALRTGSESSRARARLGPVRDALATDFSRGRGAQGHVHTSGLENFWSLLKRCLKGTYVNVEPFHPFRYLDKQAFRFNERKHNDQGRFEKAISGMIGIR